MLLGLRKDSFLMASSRTLYLEEKGDHSFACLSMASIIPSTPIEAHLLDQTANLSGVDKLVLEGSNSLMVATVYRGHGLSLTGDGYGKGGMNRWMDGGWLRSSSHQP
jgi:hypothetical protein